MAVHGFVPDDFGKGIIIPLVKDKAADVKSLNNYREITLIPVVSKLFELIILEIWENKLLTYDLQFGFKKGLGCANAILCYNQLLIITATRAAQCTHRR